MPGADFDALLPVGLLLRGVNIGADRISILARSATTSSTCPDCQATSARVHSRYQRHLLDLPSHGRTVDLRVSVRRFRCANTACRRNTFVEPLGQMVAPRSARRTCRLEQLVHRLGIALGGRPAASLARRLMLPVSKDTLLRVVRRRATADTQAAPRIIGIDDWAWRRGQRYGTLVYDLERRRVVDLLPDREVATVADWITEHPGIAVIARDRAGGYAQAAAQAAPKAIQVADRWHLMENARAAFLEAVRRAMAPIRRALGSGTVDPALLTAAERLQYEGYQRREAEVAEIQALARDGVGIKAIMRRTGRSRKLVRSVVRGRSEEVFRGRMTILAPHLVRLEGVWAGGCRSGAVLWRMLGGEGFRGSLRVVAEWATRRRRSEQANALPLRKPPQSRHIARLMLADRGKLSAADALIITAITAAIPALAAARDLVARFHHMLRTGGAAGLPGWIAAVSGSSLAAFGRGISADLAAVTAALELPWSNGATEGSITKLKLLRRQMFGRGKLDLLRARLIAPA